MSESGKSKLLLVYKGGIENIGVERYDTKQLFNLFVNHNKSHCVTLFILKNIIKGKLYPCTPLTDKEKACTQGQFNVID